MKKDYTDNYCFVIIPLVVVEFMMIVQLINMSGNTITSQIQESTGTFAMDTQTLTSVGSFITGFLAVLVSIIALIVQNNRANKTTSDGLSGIKDSLSGIKDGLSNINSKLSSQTKQITEQSIPTTNSIREDTVAIRHSVDKELCPSVQNIASYVSEQRTALAAAKISVPDIQNAFVQINALAERYAKLAVVSQQNEQKLALRIESLEASNRELLRENEKNKEIIAAYKKKLRDLTRDDDELER